MSRGLDTARELPSLLRKRPKIIIIGLSVFVLLGVVVLMAALVEVNGAFPEQNGGQEISGALSPRAIPAEELFMPDEPDFLPKVILERERRERWTAENAVPYWTNPLEGGGDPYIDRVHRTIDGIMERVP
ncbi:MAG: hypothetical protein LBG76_00395 [Treponema sp.]|nr:hypothetical protein [Treponema sp.]